MNDLPPFDQINPSAENIAKYFCDELARKTQTQGLRIESVTVFETETTSATYRPSHGA